MSRFLSFLTGLALLGQVSHVTAQTGAVKNKGLEQFFSSIFRSSSPVVSDGHPKTTEGKGEHDVWRNNDLLHNDLLHNDLLRASCEKIMKESFRITYLNDRSGKMKLQLRGIYTQGPALYFLFRMHNRSALDYEVDAIRFFIADPQNRKNPLVPYPVVRSGELKPLYVYDSSSMVRGYSQVTNVIVLPRFTLPYGKRLLIEVLERNGGRHLQLQTSNFMLERAHTL